MLRTLGAVLAGFIAGAILNSIMVVTNVMLFPLPPEADFNDRDALVSYIRDLPTSAFFLVLVAHVGQAALGGWVAARLAPSVARVQACAMAVGILSLIGGIINASSLPLPQWMSIEMPLYLIAAWMSGNVEMGRRQRLLAAKVSDEKKAE